MAKKKTAGSSTSDATTTSTQPAAARRRRTAAAATAANAPAPPTPPIDTANERVNLMPEPAGQRVSPANTSGSDSVTFMTAENNPPSYEEIAEAAYKRYLSRGGRDGRDFDDWIEAERELRSR